MSYGPNGSIAKPCRPFCNAPTTRIASTGHIFESPGLMEMSKDAWRARRSGQENHHLPSRRGPLLAAEPSTGRAEIVSGLQVGQSFNAIPVPDPPVIRKGASGSFYDKGLEGASHHAVIPNVNTINKLREVWPRLSSDEKKTVRCHSAGLSGSTDA